MLINGSQIQKYRRRRGEKNTHTHTRARLIEFVFPTSHQNLGFLEIIVYTRKRAVEILRPRLGGFPEMNVDVWPAGPEQSPIGKLWVKRLRALLFKCLSSAYTTCAQTSILEFKTCSNFQKFTVHSSPNVERIARVLLTRIL